MFTGVAESRLHRSMPGIVIAIAISGTLAACAGAATPVPSAGATASPIAAASEVAVVSPSPSTVLDSPSPSLAESDVPATPSPTPGKTPITIPGCPTSARAGALPSDVLTGVAVGSRFGVDIITFTFGQAGPQPGGTPTGEVKPARPPFAAGGSGQPVTISGDRFIQVTFRQMTLADDAGNPTYAGPDDIKPTALAVRELRQLEAFEGVVTWVAGVRGPGCVRVTRKTSPDRLILEIQQP